MYERFAQLLEETHLSSYRVSKDTGIAQTTLSAWKQGISTPKMDKLQTIAEYFGVTLDWLIGKSDNRNGSAIFEVNEFINKPKRVAPKELKKLLTDEAITLNGRLLNDEDKQKMYRIIEAAFWDAKQMNKRKKTSIEFNQTILKDSDKE